MNPTQRWVLIGGVAVAVVVVASAIYFFTRPPAAVTAEFDGVVARGEGRDFSLTEVQVRDSKISLCSREDLTVRLEREPVALKPGDRVTIKGEYDGRECRVIVKSVDHYVKVTVPAPVAIELEGVVARAGQESFTLSEITVFAGPRPCSLDRLAIQVDSRDLMPSAPLQAGDLVTVKGHYHPEDCTVRLSAPTHSLAQLSAPPVPVPQPPVTPPGVPQPQPPVVPIPTPIPPSGGLPFFISGGVSAIGPVMAFRGSVGMALGGALKGMISVGYGSGSIQKPELTKPVNFTVMPVDLTVWYQISGGLHIGAGAGVLIVHGPKPKFSNTVPAIHIAVGFAINDFLMLSGGIAYVP